VSGNAAGQEAEGPGSRLQVRPQVWWLSGLSVQWSGLPMLLSGSFNPALRIRVHLYFWSRVAEVFL